MSKLNTILILLSLYTTQASGAVDSFTLSESITSPIISGYNSPPPIMLEAKFDGISNGTLVTNITNISIYLVSSAGLTPFPGNGSFSAYSIYINGSKPAVDLCCAQVSFTGLENNYEFASAANPNAITNGGVFLADYTLPSSSPGHPFTSLQFGLDATHFAIQSLAGAPKAVASYQLIDNGPVPTATPIPATLWMFLTGIAGLIGVKRTNK